MLFVLHCSLFGITYARTGRRFVLALLTAYMMVLSGCVAHGVQRPQREPMERQCVSTACKLREMWRPM